MNIKLHTQQIISNRIITAFDRKSFSKCQLHKIQWVPNFMLRLIFTFLLKSLSDYRYYLLQVTVWSSEHKSNILNQNLSLLLKKEILSPVFFIQHLYNSWYLDQWSYMTLELSYLAINCVFIIIHILYSKFL